MKNNRKMIAKHFTETSNKVKLQINRVRINRARPVSSRTSSFYAYGKGKMILDTNQLFFCRPRTGVGIVATLTLE